MFSKPDNCVVCGVNFLMLSELQLTYLILIFSNTIISQNAPGNSPYALCIISAYSIMC